MGLFDVGLLWLIVWVLKNAAVDVVSAAQRRPIPSHERWKAKHTGAVPTADWGVKTWASNLVADGLAAQTERRREKAAQKKLAADPVDTALVDAVDLTTPPQGLRPETATVATPEDWTDRFGPHTQPAPTAKEGPTMSDDTPGASPEHLGATASDAWNRGDWDTAVAALDELQERHPDSYASATLHMFNDQRQVDMSVDRVHAEALRRAAEQPRSASEAEPMPPSQTPCPASWSATTPCQHPDGDAHAGLCFNDDSGERETWDRNTSYFCEPMSPAERKEARAAAPTPPTNVIQFPSSTNPKENHMSTTGEVVGLDQSIAYAKSLAKFAADHASAGNEGYIGHLTSAEVSGATLQSAHEMQAKFGEAMAAAQKHAEDLKNQKSVQEAYDNAPDAGNKQFQMAGR